MTRRLALPMLVFALSLLGVSPGIAEGFDLGLLRAGMPLVELRHAAWPTGSRLLCAGDANLPTTVKSAPGEGIELPPRAAGRGMVPCALFAAGSDGAWTPRMMAFGGIPARIWVLALVEKEGDEPRLVQAKLWQPDDAFAATLAFVTGRLGSPTSANDRGARWSNADSEAIIGHLSAGGIYTILTETHLEAVVRERTGTPEAKP